MTGFPQYLHASLAVFVAVVFSPALCSAALERINRQALVTRHNVVLTNADH